MAKKQKKTTGSRDPRSRLPSVNALLEIQEVQDLVDEHSRVVVVEVLREVLSELGATLKKGGAAPKGEGVARQAASILGRRSIDRLRTVVNATGIVLHTGLGRAPLPREASSALGGLHQCCNLQVDMEDGQRGKRNYMSEKLLCRLTGAEAAMVVNNNAAATFLILAAMCKGREVIISRGQLIEIGGSFRLPDCMRQSGAVMREVGTTNKTHLRDYENALNENTAAIMRVHPSNYRIVGFHKEVSIAEMAGLKKKQDFVLIDDLGCGALVDLSRFGLPKEPTVPDSIADGADLVCSSGDKLIGGPQAGLIVGRKDLIARIKKHPLTRMLRVCKLTDMALEKTLRLFLDPENLAKKHPVLRIMTTPLQTLKRRAQGLKNRLEREKVPFRIRVVEEKSAVGGGTMPDFPLDTYALAIQSPDLSPEEVSRFLRENDPPVPGRISNNGVILDVRTLLEGEERIIAKALGRIARS